VTSTQYTLFSFFWWRKPPALFELRVALFFTPTRQSPAPKAEITSDGDGEVFAIPIILRIDACFSFASALVMECPLA